MANDLPTGLTELGRVLEHKDVTVDVMGVVVDYMAAKPSRGSDWTCAFSIADLYSKTEGVRVRFFASQMDMPKIQGIGDVVLLRGVKSTLFQGSELLISNFGTSWVVFPSEKIPLERPEFPLKLDYFCSKDKWHPSKVPSKLEMAYALDLCNLQERNSFQQIRPVSLNASNPGLTSSFRTREKFSLLKGVQANNF